MIGLVRHLNECIDNIREYDLDNTFPWFKFV